MLGVLVASLVEFVQAKGGAALCAQLWEQAGLPVDQPVRLDVEYEDARWQSLYAAAVSHVAALGPGRQTPAEAEREYAFFAGEWLVSKFPGLIQGATSARAVLQRQPLIHNTMGRAHRNLATRRRVDSKFHIAEQGDDLVVTYSSPNDHARLYRDLVDWVAFKFQERIDVTHTEQAGPAQPVHVFHLRFLGKQVVSR